MSEISRKNNIKNKYSPRFYILITISLIILVFFSFFIKNLIVTKKCEDSLYAIDYYLTHYENKNLRLIKVETISVIKQEKNSFTLEAIGMKSIEPFNKITVLATFNKNENNTWILSSLEELDK